MGSRGWWTVLGLGAGAWSWTAGVRPGSWFSGAARPAQRIFGANGDCCLRKQRPYLPHCLPTRAKARIQDPELGHFAPCNPRVSRPLGSQAAIAERIMSFRSQLHLLLNYLQCVFLSLYQSTTSYSTAEGAATTHKARGGARTIE